jgi:predicted O-methyltransferase YrrM
MTRLYPERIDRYMRELLPERPEVFLRMEAEAERRDIPIVGPAVGSLLLTLASCVGARRVFELGSAIGYSTAWFASAVGPQGSVIYTDGDRAKANEARKFLEELGLSSRVDLRVGDAVSELVRSDGVFDVIFCDIDKEGYPAALEAAAPRVRPGGLLIADNTLWSGRVADASAVDSATEAIRRFNALLFARRDFATSIVPLRDGVTIAWKRP